MPELTAGKFREVRGGDASEADEVVVAGVEGGVNANFACSVGVSFAESRSVSKWIVFNGLAGG